MLRMFNLVWLVDPEHLFETEWIRFLLAPKEYIEIKSSQNDNTLYHNALFVFNHSVDYATVFKLHEDASIPFAAIHLSDECLSDDFTFYHYHACKFVFRNYYHPFASKMPKVVTFGLGYKTNFANIQVHTKYADYYNWCFAGNIHDTSRLKALLQFASIHPYKMNITQDGFNSANSLSLEEYKQYMVESKFCICPIGQGNIDTFRLYEAMEAGSIPVTLSMTNHQKCLPSYWHYLFGETDIPFVFADTMVQCSNIVNATLKDADTYYDMKHRVQDFWKRVKQKWKNKLSELLDIHIAFRDT